MTTKELLARITVNPAVCHGKPCIRGTRVWVSLILDLMADGKSQQEILGEYPHLSELDLRACIAYAAEVSGGRFIDVAKDGACA